MQPLGSSSTVRGAPPPRHPPCTITNQIDPERADTEYLPSDISRYLWRIRDLHTRHDESRAQLDEHLQVFAKLAIPRKAAKVPSADTETTTTNGVNGLQRVVDSVSDKEMELRLLISQCINDASLSAKESAVEAQRLQDHVHPVASLGS
jgi:hypothetical protein